MSSLSLAERIAKDNHKDRDLSMVVSDVLLCKMAGQVESIFIGHLFVLVIFTDYSGLIVKNSPKPGEDKVIDLIASRRFTTLVQEGSQFGIGDELQDIAEDWIANIPEGETIH